MYAYQRAGAGTEENKMNVYPEAVTDKKADAGTHTSTLVILKVESLAERIAPIKLSLCPPEPAERIKVMTNVREVFKCSNATPIQSVSLTGYACCYCKGQYQAPALLKSHTLDSHPNEESSSITKAKDMTRFHVKVDITGLHCKICSGNFDTLDQLMHHLHGSHDKKLYLDAKNYMVPFKFDSDALQCYICHNQFTSFKMFFEHMNTHCRNFVCTVCNAGFLTRNGLKSHSRSHELGVFGCDFCEKVLATLPRKKSHEKNVHSGGAMVNKCGYCKVNFKHCHEKIKHLQQVHGVVTAPVKCHACDRTFTSQKVFRHHTKRIHLMERKYRCSQCEKTFYTSQELKDHMLKHTGERNFQCDVCLKSYLRKYTLRQHLRIHDNDKRYKCKHCRAAFVAKSNWRIHMRSRHGEVF